jgi:hypothetical protein
MCFKTCLNNKPIFSSTSGTPQYYLLLKFFDWSFVRILYGTRILVYCILCTNVILIILHYWITLLTLVNERCMRLLIMPFCSSCCFLFPRALPCLRPLVACPYIGTPEFEHRPIHLGCVVERVIRGQISCWVLLDSYVTIIVPYTTSIHFIRMVHNLCILSNRQLRSTLV